ncbi:short-chain dehydrogenase [Roseibacillus persicicus]|uniref:Uncharacterized protein n=1 Tax=Roseibacillus persicicus TaxID=454148 RepID=A0A918TYK1_9BACT|nr:short-chain dehydrogenase [Roseibacillus persicicus]GHC67841.1 hypothetical protein GCM10007100_39970 [Roseibacillus persicicus]
MSSENDEITEDLPTAAELCVTRSLYTVFKLSRAGGHEYQLYQFITSNQQIDTFCPWCAQPTVLLGGKTDLEMESHQFDLRDRTFEKRYFCSRHHDHEFYFYFRLEKQALSKVGQTPSMADIEQGHIQHYRQVLDRSNYQELNRALGLASHGVGIGSFVYLRRIFERLVEEARVEGSKKNGWDEAAYQRGRMDEKILLLRDFLPEFLVEQRVLYGIMSKGVHSLDEETCLAHFPVVRTGIELILDQKLALDQQRKKMDEAKKQISNVQMQIKKD